MNKPPTPHALHPTNQNTKRILVTGGAGFIGSNLVDALVENGHDVAIVDNLSTGFKENINEKAKFFGVDICDKDALKEVFQQFQPEAVYHLAAQINVRKSLEDPESDVKVNVTGSINVLECASLVGIKKFIFSSTGGAIYGEEAELPTPETTVPEPPSPYGIDKLASEKFVKFYANKYNFSYNCLRYSNVYGPRQNPHGEAGVVAIFSAEILKNDNLDIFGDGSQTRDYIFVGDVVRANLAALQSPDSDVYNIATGVETSIMELVEKLKVITGNNPTITHLEAKSGELMRSCLDNRKAQTNLNFQPETSLDEGLKKTVEHIKNAKSQ
jgi:UDP-glucose 4-epimerase